MRSMFRRCKSFLLEVRRLMSKRGTT